MDRVPYQEDLFEFRHGPGDSPGSFWRGVRSAIADAEARGATPIATGLPPIQMPDSHQAYPASKPHTPGYHGDSPTPPQGLPPIPDHTKEISSTTRPPNPTQQLFFKKTDIEQTQARVIDKYTHTHPIHRGMIEAIEEPHAWKIQKKKRVDNAIQRVNKSYVIDPRSYQEPDINERVDAQFMPTPPTCPKPRKNNLVILDPEKMIRDRNNMRGDIAPGRPPAQVPEGCHRRVAAQISGPTHGHSSTTLATTSDGTAAASVRSGVPLYNQRYAYGQSAAGSHHTLPQQVDSYDHTMSSAHRLTAHEPVYDQAKEWRQEHNNRVYMAHERIQQEYIDELRMEDTSTSSQCEVDLDVKRQQLLARKCIEKRRKEAAALKNTELLAASQSVSAAQRATTTSQLFKPAPPTVSHPVDDSYSKRRRHFAACQSESVVQHVQPSFQTYQPAPPSVTCTDDDSYSKRRRHLVYQHAQQTTDTNMATRETNGYAADTQKQEFIPRFNKPTHGPTIRVEPQLTWNASAAKRGLGFKSKLRREQEEAAIQRKEPTASTDVPRETIPATPKLSEEARRRWKNKTIVNKP